MRYLPLFRLSQARGLEDVLGKASMRFLMLFLALGGESRLHQPARLCSGSVFISFFLVYAGQILTG